MSNVVNISEFRNNISEYINRVIYKKDTFLLKKGKSIVAKVTAYEGNKEVLTEEKIKKYAGILKDSDAKKVRRYMKKFRQSFKILSLR